MNYQSTSRPLIKPIYPVISLILLAGKSSIDTSSQLWIGFSMIFPSLSLHVGRYTCTQCSAKLQVAQVVHDSPETHLLHA